MYGFEFGYIRAELCAGIAGVAAPENRDEGLLPRAKGLDSGVGDELPALVAM